MLSLAMIVRNEAAFLPRCLESVQDLVDAAVIVDTGSEDATVDIARRFGADTVSIPWHDDFSRARNACLQMVETEWILVLDADEAIGLRDQDAIRRLIREGGYFGFSLEQRTYGNDPHFKNWVRTDGQYEEERPYAGYVRSSLIRLFKNDDRIRFEGPVHELVEPSFERYGLPFLKTSIPIHHYGKVREPQRVEEKARRYLAIGQKKAAAAPQDPKALSELGAQYLELKSYDRAAELFSKVTDLRPVDPEPHIDLGVTLLRGGQLDAAVRALKKAVCLAPEHPDALFNLGAVRLRQQRYDDAEAIFSRIIDTVPDCGNAYAALGAIHLCRGRIEEAVPFLLHAVRLNPGDADAHSNLAWAFLRMGWPDQARSSSRTALDLCPGHRNAERIAGEAETAAEKPASRTLAQALCRRAEALFADSRFDLAKDIFDSACRQDPRCGNAWNGLGVVHWQTGNKDQALACFLRALFLMGADPDVEANIAEASRILGKKRLSEIFRGVSGFEN